MPAARYWDGTKWTDLSLGTLGGQYLSTVIGDGAATSFTLIHRLGSRNVMVACYRTATPWDEVEVDVERTDLDTITVRTFPVVPAVGELTVVVAAPGTQAALNITMDVWHTVGAAGEPAFQNSWVNFGGGLRSAAFRKYPDGKVRLVGTVKTGASGTVVFTLPVGYRPPTNQTILTVQSGASPSALVGIGSDGTVVVTGAGASTFTYFDGVEFDTEAVLQTASVAAQPLDAWHVVGAAGEPAYATGGAGGNWTAANVANFTNLRFRRDPAGRVSLQGMAKPTTFTASDVVFTLPVGYRPSANLVFTTRAVGTTGSDTANRVDVYSDGRVIMVSGGTANPAAWVDFSTIEFDTESVAAYASGIIGPPRVTALPANPVDGQECYFVADATNGVLWHLRYNAGSASAYKWEAVGGSPLHAEVATAGTMTGTSFGDPTTGGTGPTVTLPLAGDYDVTLSALLYQTGGGAGTYSYAIGAAAAQGADGIGQSSTATGIYHHKIRRKTGMAAATALTAKYYTSANTFNFSDRVLRAMPVRVG